jgi:hypothetical protein
LPFNNENQRFAVRVGDVAISLLGMAKIAWIHLLAEVLAIFIAPMHCNLTLQDPKYFGAIIDMPVIGAVGPVGAYADPINGA